MVCYSVYLGPVWARSGDHLSPTRRSGCCFRFLPALVRSELSLACSCVDGGEGHRGEDGEGEGEEGGDKPLPPLQLAMVTTRVREQVGRRERDSGR